MAFGALKGVFTGNATSIGTSLALSTLASGSGAVNVGDLVYVVAGEQTANTVTAVTDNLGNTYTPTQVATDAGTATARAFWARVTVAGTITSVTITANGGSNNGAGAAAIFEGPFAASPLDKNPTNITTDVTSPFTCPSSGTLTQADELGIGWSCSTGSAVWTATSPNLLAAQVATASVLSVRIGYQVTAATTAIAPVFAGTNPTDGVLGTTTFLKAPPLVQGHYRFRTDAGGVDATPTWGAAEDTTYLPVLADPFRLRFVVSNTGGAPTGSGVWQIYLSRNGAAYAPITTTSAGVVAIDAGSSADNASLTTQRLTSGTGSFANGQYDETGATAAQVLTNGNFTEFEFGLKLVPAELFAGDTLDFRVYRDGVALETYSVTPRITIAAAAGVFAAIKTGYKFSNTASDLTGATQNKTLVSSGAASGTWSGQSLGAAASVSASFFTPGSDPGSDGLSTKAATVRLHVSTGNASLRYAVRLLRVNSSGVVQAEGTFSAESSSGATGEYYFLAPITDLGTWSSGDRLRVDVGIRNTGGAGQSMTMDYTLDGGSAVNVTWANSTSSILNYADTSDNHTLSGGNLTATHTANDGNYSTSRANVGQLVSGGSAKIYWEETITNIAGSGAMCLGAQVQPRSPVGGGTGNASIEYIGIDSRSIGVFPITGGDQLWYNGAAAVTFSTGAVVNGTLWCFAADLGNMKFWARRGAAGNWNNAAIGSQDPANNIGGVDISASSVSGFFDTLCPAFDTYNTAPTADSVTVNLGGSAYVGTAPTGFTNPDGTTIGAPTQNLTPALYTETDTFFSPTITVGAVTLTPSLFTETDTFFTPTVGRGAVALTPSLYVETDTFFTPVVSVGAVTLVPALFTESDTFFTPVVTRGAVALVAALFTETDTFFAPAVSHGLRPSLYTEADVFFTPVITVGAVTLTPSLFVESDTFFTHSVSGGGVVNVAPDLFVESDTFFSPAITVGAVTLVPSLFTEADTFFSPAVTVAAVDLSPALFTESDVFFTPIVSRGAVALTPDLYIESDIFYTPTVSAIAAQDLAPSLYVETDFFYPPTITVTEFGVITSGWESQVGVWRKTGRAGRTGKRYRIYR